YDAENGMRGAPLTMGRHNGQLYLGTTAGIHYLDTEARRFRPVAGPSEQAFTLWAAGGDLLAGILDSGLYTVAGDRVQPLGPARGAIYSGVMGLLDWERESGTVLVELVDGLAVLQRGPNGWRDAGRIPGVDEDLLSVSSVEANVLWATTLAGEALRIQLPALAPDGSGYIGTAQVARFGPEDGVPAGDMAVQRLDDEVLAMGSGEAAARFDKTAQRFVPDTRFDAARGGHPLAAFALQPDDQGAIWIAKGHGAPSVAHPQPDGTYDITTLHEMRSHRVLDILPEADGIVWLFGDRELIRYDTRQAQALQADLRPRIRRVTLGDAVLHGGFGAPQEADVVHSRRALTVSFALPGATSETRFRTRLDGFEAEWSEWSTATSRTFTNLGAGTYRFRVAAEAGAREAVYTLRIRAAWYQTLWAIVLYILCGIALVAFIVRIRTDALERRQRALEQTIAERTEELKQSFADLQTTQKQLIHAEKMASLGALTAGIAHEIKNPLNFINNFAEVNEELADELREDLEDHPSALAAIDDLLDDLRQNAFIIRQHGKRADGIVKSMMAHARTGSSTAEETNLNALIDEHIGLAYHGKRASHPGFTADVVRDLDAEVGHVSVMPQDLGRVILNVVGNAFDALMEAGTPDPRVTISTHRTDDHVEIRVEDNGPGMPKAVREKVFEPFFTTKPAGQGTGLGLSLSYDIITQGHNGTMRVESAPGQGTAFTITLLAAS
ncbi:MAG: ATP-binding protein, partial [Bacteroidota bacterium]